MTKWVVILACLSLCVSLNETAAQYLTDTTGKVITKRENQQIPDSLDMLNCAYYDSLQAWADSVDSAGYIRADSINASIYESRAGHKIVWSIWQYCIMCNGGALCPVRYIDETTGERITLYEYYPLDRGGVWCGGHIYQVP